METQGIISTSPTPTIPRWMAILSRVVAGSLWAGGVAAAFALVTVGVIPPAHTQQLLWFAASTAAGSAVALCVGSIATARRSNTR